MVLGRIISGKFGEICVRQRSDADIELGELMIAEESGNKSLLQVYDLTYGSQVSQQNLELISGMNLEENAPINFFDSKLRNYKLVYLKNLITISNISAKTSKTLPDFFSPLRSIEKEDLNFLTTPKDPIFVGKIRSGSKMLDVDINLPGENVLSHHILIPATTGKGKSNLLSVMLWNLVDKLFCGMLVLDPHDEYYGRNHLGLKDHSSKMCVYYTSKDPPVGALSLKICIKDIKPQHFDGSISWTDAQRDLVYHYYKRFGVDWITRVMEEEINPLFNEATLNVVKRKLSSMLDIKFKEGTIISNGIFHPSQGTNTLIDIVRDLENAKTVIIDTSPFSGSLEILVGSLVTNYLFNKYKYYKSKGLLDNKPVVSIVIEEAPRVLGKDVLEQGSNIFSTIAREGRKFKVGLIAVTQLPSLIPREILANMNTKIILGIEMAPERVSVIDSAAQDLSRDNRTIASLDKGEAIITSNFTRFAIPVKIPLFKDFVKETQSTLQNINNINTKQSFSGMEMEE